MSGYYYTPPITRNGFTYIDPDKFYVENDPHRHPRADAGNLYATLTYAPPPPVLTKKGTIAKRQPPPFEDPPAHFFTAQMAHYGLRPLKTKELAKQKLLAAFASAGEAGKGLVVPPAILELENALKKEWHDADEMRKAELEVYQAAYKETMERSGVESAYHDLDGLVEDDRQPRMKMAADKDTSGSDADGELTKADIEDEIENIPIARARGLLLKLLQEDPRAKRIMETDILQTRNAAIERKETGQPLKREDWEGKFVLKCPAINQGWGYDHHEFSLTICPSSTSSRLWISFDLGVISGVMRSARGLPTAVGEQVVAEWRGSEDGEGVMTFGKRNRAVLTFFGDGNVEGELKGDFCAGKARFTGCKDKSARAAGRLESRVKGMKTEFRSYNGHNYEVVNRSRWGKWGGEEREERAYESDTSGGGRKRKRDVEGDVESSGSYDEAY